MPTKGATFPTKQKREVQAVIDRFDGPFTVQDVRAKLEESRSEVSRASAYRVVQSLVVAGKLQQILLPDGRHVFAHTRPGASLCVLECADCGKFFSCEAAGLNENLVTAAARYSLNPLQSAIHVLARCKRTSCEMSGGIP